MFELCEKLDKTSKRNIGILVSSDKGTLTNVFGIYFNLTESIHTLPSPCPVHAIG